MNQPRRTFPPPGTVEPVLHPKFIPGSDSSFRPFGWFFDSSFVVRVRHGISRSTGVNLTPSGHTIDLGPGLEAPPSTYESLYHPFSRGLHIDDSVATLTTLWAANYFHWLFDVLPRLDLVERAGLKTRSIYAPLRHAFQRETLQLLGYPPAKIIDASRIRHLSATELVIPSLPGTPGVMPEWVCRFLRQKLVPVPSAIHTNPERIYVSRGAARSRRIINEPQMLELLATYGFTAIKLETMSFAEQVRLFQSARCIVAPHGAGLANLVFCEPGTCVVEILPSRETNLCYWLLSQQVSLRYWYVLGSATGPPSNDMEVDLEKLRRSLDLGLRSSADAAQVPLTV